MIHRVGYGEVGPPASLYAVYVFPFVLNWFGRAYFVISALVAGIFDRFGGGVQDGMRCRFTLITGVSVRFCLFTEVLQCAAPLQETRAVGVLCCRFGASYCVAPLRETRAAEMLYCRFEAGCCAAPLRETRVAGVLYFRFGASCCAAPLRETVVVEVLCCRFGAGCCVAPLRETAVAGVLYCWFEAGCCAAP